MAISADFFVATDRPLSPAQIERAAVLYESGWSLARVGSDLGCDPSTVWRVLNLAGVRFRDSQGRDKRLNETAEE